MDFAYVLWFVAVFSSIMVVHSKEVFHSALYLALTFVAVAGLFLMLDAEFLAVIQILIYAGAVTVIALFAIMLTRREEGVDVLGLSLNSMKIISVVVFGVVIISIIVFSQVGLEEKLIYGSTYNIATLLFESYILHFELIAYLLLGALIAAVYLARRDENES